MSRSFRLRDQIEGCLDRAGLPVEQQPHIIATTANAMVEDREPVWPRGKDEPMAEPVRARGLKKLFARVDTTINRPPRSGPPAEPEQPAEQASPPAVEPVDEAVISELRNEIDDEDGSALDGLIGDYIADSSQTLRELEVAVSIEDTPRISRLTHSWKSTSAILGASQLSALLARAETAALQAPEELAALITEIQQEHERVNLSLRHIRTAGRGD